MIRLLLISLSLIATVACTSEDAQAPVVEGWLQSQAQEDQYRVKQGDTLYSIAWDFGLDYQTLADANHLSPPYPIHTGQLLKMTSCKPGASTVVTRKLQTHVVASSPKPAPKAVASTPNKTVYHAAPATTVVTSHLSATAQARAPLSAQVSHWQWPTHGKVIAGFSTALAGNHGVNIAGTRGQAVYAAAAGDVVYCGTGVRGYGNLVILKHNRYYLSAYAYNQQLLVKLGQRVRSGQEIATMGHNDAGQVMLHFEIRHNGKPVDPKPLLR